MKDASLPDAVHQEARHQITSMETGLLLQLKKLVKNSAPHTVWATLAFNVLHTISMNFHAFVADNDFATAKPEK